MITDARSCRRLREQAKLIGASGRYSGAGTVALPSTPHDSPAREPGRGRALVRADECSRRWLRPHGTLTRNRWIVNPLQQGEGRTKSSSASSDIRAATPCPPSPSSWARHCGRSQRTGGRTIPPWAGSGKPPPDRRQQVPASATGELFMSGRPTICPHAQLVEKEHQRAMERPLGVKRTSKPLTAYGLPASVCTCRAKG